MDPKATPDLSQLAPDEFIAEVSKGLQLVFENVQTLAADADLLCHSERPRGGRILLAFAEEEAAKILILLDAVRCPARTGPERAVRQKHLKKFNDHIAKGIYVASCHWRASSFEELSGYIAAERDSLTLNDSGYEVWIERNKILEDREGSIYVSYVRSNGKNHWNSPSLYPKDLAMFNCDVGTSSIIRLVRSLERSGFYTEAGLRELASIWHGISIVPDLDFHVVREANRTAVNRMVEMGLVGEISGLDIGRMTEDWSYPLYCLDLHKNEIKISEMEETKKEAQRDIKANIWF